MEESLAAREITDVSYPSQEENLVISSSSTLFHRSRDKIGYQGRIPTLTLAYGETYQEPSNTGPVE